MLHHRCGKFWTTSHSRHGFSHSHLSADCGYKLRQGAGFFIFSTDDRVLPLLIKFGRKSHNSRLATNVHHMRTQFSSRVYCTDASPSGGGACMTVGLTKEGVEAGRGEMFRSGKTCSREIPAELAAKALVLGLLRRADHRGTDVRIEVQRSDAWPRSPICPRKWFWKAILSFPWKRPGAHINELRASCFVLSPAWSFKVK